MYQITERLLRFAAPIVLQFMILMIAGMLLPGAENAGAATSLAALLQIPVWFLIWRKDRPIRDARMRADGQSTAAGMSDAGTEIWRGNKLVLGAAVCAAAGAALSYAAGHAMTALGFYERYSNQAQEQLLDTPFLVQLIGLGILVPIAEEWLYRGIVYGRIREWAPVWLSVVVTAGMFALGHGNVIQIVYALPMGLILSALYVYSGNLLIPIAFHMGANLITIFIA